MDIYGFSAYGLFWEDKTVPSISGKQCIFIIGPLERPLIALLQSAAVVEDELFNQLVFFILSASTLQGVPSADRVGARFVKRSYSP